MKKNKRKENKFRGFTLVEIMVSVAIFTMVVTMGISSLIAIMKAQNHSQEYKKAEDAFDYVLENFTRELRLGKNYYFAPDTEGDLSPQARDGSQVFTGESDYLPLIGFSASDDRGYMVYFLSNGVLKRKDYYADGTSFTHTLTDKSQIIITRMRVSVMHTDTNDEKQPLVWIQTEGKLPKNSNKKIVVQTLVSQRELDTNT